MSKALIPAQRRERIQEYLTVHKIARILDLRRLLGASEATVRRDLDWLEGEGLVERTHGGAILSRRLDSEAEYQHRAHVFYEEKEQIGAMAASLVEDGDTIFVNSGTTTTQLVKHLGHKTNLTVITNNLIAVLEAGEVAYDLILLGGAYQSKSSSVAGRFAIGNLSHVYANKAFIGVDGISLQYGCTVPSISEAEVNRLMVDRTHGQIIVVADHSKWGRLSNFEIAKVEQINTLVTDSGLGEEAQIALRSRSVDILFADKFMGEFGA